MKYEITYSCGHVGTVDLYGSLKERDRKIEYFEQSGLCKECYKKMKDEERKKSGLVLRVAVDGGGAIIVAADGWTEGREEELESLGFNRRWIDPFYDSVGYEGSKYVWCIWFLSPTMIADSKAKIAEFTEKMHPAATYVPGPHVSQFIQQTQDEEEEKAKTPPEPSPKPPEPAPIPKKKSDSWRSIAINLQNIDYKGDKSARIKMPNASKYAGMTFWHPISLLKEGSHSHEVVMLFKPSFDFKLTQNGKGKHNRKQVIKEETIGSDEMLEAFGGEWQYPAYGKKSIEDEEVEFRHVPPVLSPVDIEADENLKRKPEESDPETR